MKLVRRAQQSLNVSRTMMSEMKAAEYTKHCCSFYIIYLQKYDVQTACAPASFCGGTSLQGLAGRRGGVRCGLSTTKGQLSSFPRTSLSSLSPESTRTKGEKSSDNAFSSSVSGIASNCFGIGLRGSYIVGGRLRAKGGAIAWYP